MKIKKTIAAIAAAAMVFSSLPMTVLADETNENGSTPAVDGGVTETPSDEISADGNAGIDVQALPSFSSATVSNINGASHTETVSGNTVTIELSKTGDTVTGSSNPSGSLVDGNHTSDYTNGAFKVTIPGDFSNYTMPKMTNTADDKYYMPDDNNEGATNLKSTGLVLYLDADAVFADSTPDTVTYKVPIKQKDSDTTEYITIVLKNVTPAADDDDDSGLTVSGNTATVRDDTVENGSGTAAITTSEGVINVAVTLTPEEGKTIGGKPQQGSEEPTAPQNYHITIPFTNLTASQWELVTGADNQGGQYGYDNGGHTEWNVDTNKVMLWLPVENGTCKVVLKKKDSSPAVYQVINVTTTIASNTVVVPEHTHTYSVGEGEFWGHLNTCTADGCVDNALKYVWVDHTVWADGYVHGVSCDICGYSVIDQPHVDSDNNGHCDVCNSDDLRNLATPVTPAPAPSTSSSSGFVAPPATITTTTVVSTTASTPAQVRTSTKSNITINAAETKVTSAIMNAFTKNKKAKTLTISYGTKMKIAIKKSDVKGTANVDFSVSGKSFLSSKVKNSAALAKAKKITQIDFVKEGKLDGVDKATVQSRVGAKYVGRKATVYEYVNGKLVKVAKTTVGGSGLVKFNIDHYGQYVIAVE